MNDDHIQPAWHAGDIPAEAAAWFARHRADSPHPGDPEAFESWSSDPRALAEYRRVSVLWSTMDAIADHPDIVAAQARTARARGRNWRTGATAVAAMAACAVGLVFIPRSEMPQQIAAAPLLQSFRSTVGQRMPVALADGSIVTLDTDSAITVQMDAGHRRVTLDRGRAFFKVAHAPDRPFVVRADGRSVVAIGTEFSVERDMKGVDVVLVEGRVRVAPTLGSTGGTSVEMVAGDRLSVSAGNQWTLNKIDARRATSWLEGRMTFDEAPLGEVADALNRYATRKIVFADAAVARRRISAVLKTDDMNSFVAAVETLRLGKVRHGTGPDRLIIDSE